VNKYFRALVAGACAAMAVGVVAACSSGAQQVASSSSTTTSAVAPMPSSATFIADMPDKNGQTMTMAVTVDGDKVVAYATNGTDDEAYFFGTQKDGQMDLMSMYGDNLRASFDGKNVTGEVTMNETGSAPAKFTAASVAAPAGLYTAAHGNSRATWVVRPDHTITGVMDNSAPGDHKVTDAIMARDKAFMDQVRQMRMNRQLQQAPPMTYGSWSMHMGDSSMTAVRVTGDMSY
jgi:hypothetical protein